MVKLNYYTFGVIGDVMVSVLASNAVDSWFVPVESNQRLYNWYLLLFR